MSVRLAMRALASELSLTPKPGLVDREGRGAHEDMDFARMSDGFHALEPALQAIALAAAQSRSASVALREELGALGRAGERAMLRASGGVNTHRGALWSIGLLVAASALEGRSSAQAIAVRAAAIARLPDRYSVASASHGAVVEVRFGVSGARLEAMRGFPAACGVALPLLRGDADGRTRALLALIARLNDTCVLYRGGITGLRFVQSGARHALSNGCTEAAMRTFAASLREAQLSPGGSADALACALYLHAVSRA